MGWDPPPPGTGGGHAGRQATRAQPVCPTRAPAGPHRSGDPRWSLQRVVGGEREVTGGGCLHRSQAQAQPPSPGLDTPPRRGSVSSGRLPSSRAPAVQLQGIVIGPPHLPLPRGRPETWRCGSVSTEGVGLRRWGASSPWPCGSRLGHPLHPCAWPHLCAGGGGRERFLGGAPATSSAPPQCLPAPVPGAATAPPLAWVRHSPSERFYVQWTAALSRASAVPLQGIVVPQAPLLLMAGQRPGDVALSQGPLLHGGAGAWRWGASCSPELPCPR